MDIATIQQLISLVCSGIVGLGTVYHSLRSKQIKSHAELEQKIQSVDTQHIIATSTLDSKIEAAKGEAKSAVSAVHGVLPVVQDLANSIAKTQTDIAQIAASVDDTVSAMHSKDLPGV